MAIIGFNFTRMLIERKAPVKGKISIKNNVAIKNVEKKEFTFGKNKQTGLRFVFEFVCEYDPKIADITLEGEVIDIQDDKRCDTILAEWKKTKKLEPAMMSNILNQVLSKANIQALILSKDMGLPPPIPMPKVNVKAGGEPTPKKK